MTGVRKISGKAYYDWHHMNLWKYGLHKSLERTTIMASNEALGTQNISIKRMACGIRMLTSNFRNVFHERDSSNLCEGLLRLVNIKHMTVLA